MMPTPPEPPAIAALPHREGRPALWLGDVRRALAGRRCWLCGGRLTGGTGAFAIDLVCASVRISFAPPVHQLCGLWGAQRPEFYSGVAPLPTRTMVVWETTEWTQTTGPGGRLALKLGEPISVRWFFEAAPMPRALAKRAVEIIACRMRLFMEARGLPDEAERDIARLRQWLPDETAEQQIILATEDV